MYELLRKICAMLGFHVKPKETTSSPDVSRSVQRNERAQANVRHELEKIKMTDVLRQISGKMK